MFLILNLQFFSSLANAGVVCESNPTPLPDEIRLVSPKLDYIGKTPDGRPAFAHINSNMIYIFEKDFADKVPRHITFYSPQFRDISNMTGGLGAIVYTLETFKMALGISCGNQSAPGVLSGFLNLKPENGVQKNQSFTLGLFPPMAKCDDGLTFNPNKGTCDIPQLVDIFAKQCEDNTDCEEYKIGSPSQEVDAQNVETSTGCFSQKVEDVFNQPGLTPLQDIVLDQSIDWEDSHNLKDANASCSHSRECKSYSCVDNKCQNPTICRLGKEGEQVQAGVDCEFGYEPDASNKCVQGEGYAPYVGMIGEITFTGEEGSEFQFNLPDDIMRKAHEAMKQIRAFEWFTLRLSKDNGDCFKLGKYLRENFGSELHRERQSILLTYSATMNQIEKDHQTMINAQEDSNEVVTFDGVSISQKDLADRQSGVQESAQFMLRKALAQLDYETRMLNLMNNMAAKAFTLSENIQKWRNNDTSWSLGDANIVQAFNCHARYDKKPPFKRWRTVHQDTIKNRWETFYLIQNNSGNNDYINQNEDFKTNLSLIFQKDVQSTMLNFVTPINLYDPLNYRADGNLKFDNFGQYYDLNDYPFPWEVIAMLGGLAAMALFGPVGFVVGAVALIVGAISALFSTEIKEIKEPREFNGTNNGTVEKFREAVKKDIFEHVKSLKVNNADKYFIYEPELANWESKNALELSTTGKDCVDDINQDVCKKVTEGSNFDNSFYRYMEMLTDYSMAQYFAYSHATTEGYKNYFTDPRSSRIKYFTRIAVDTHNLAVYYDALVRKRQEQISALDKVSDTEDNFKGGVSVDGTDYSAKKGEDAGAAAKGSNGKLEKNERKSIKSRLSVQTAKLLFGNNSASSVQDSSGGSIFGSASSSGLAEISSAVSARNAKMLAVNEKARKKGFDVDRREADRVTVFQSRPGTFATASQGSTNSNLVSNPKLKSLDAQAQEISKNLNEITSVTSGDSGSGGSGSGGFFGNVVGSQGGSGGKDSTGLSGEEKNHMLDTVDQNASKFKPDEFDSLFDVVSKAYARNLEKILNRKKPGDE